MDTQQLDEALGLLIRPSIHRVPVEGGGYKWITADPLLVTLAVEIANSSAAPKFKAANGNPLPIAAAAHDMLAAIVEEATENYWRTYPVHHITRCYTLAERLAAWCIAARLNEGELHRAAEILAGYVRAIRALLEPTRRREVRGTCPLCKHADILTRDEDGQTIRHPALSIIYSPDNFPTGIECAHCGRIADDSGTMEQIARDIVAQN